MTDALRLFLVEDDDDIALLIRKTLERAGHEVTTCRTAADALIVLSHSNFHLVVLDFYLPDMSGLELLKTINREGIAAPVLMITGRGDEHLATQVLHEGALDYIVKDPALTFLVDLPKRISESVTRYRLQEMNRLLKQALESARDGVLITNLQGEIEYVNRALEEMSGYGRRELIGQNPRLFKSDMHDPEVYSDMWRTILSRNSWQGEVINRRRDGTLVDTSITISPVFDGRQQMTHFVGICRDVRERKQLERQLLQAQKMQSVGTLAGGIAHEFNNLLAGIQGYAALGVRESDLSPTAREYFQFIVDLTERAAGLTRQLLAFARKPALSRRPTNLGKLMRTTAELVRHTVTLEVELELPEECPEASLTALADANQLQQVIMNLALNARDAVKVRVEDDRRNAEATAGGLPIRFTLRQVELEGEQIAFPENVPPGDYIVVEVCDNGIGMSQETLTQAFDPFFTTKGVGQGTGLGLPVAYGIVRGHQGFLTIDTVHLQGTCVSLYLPRLDTSRTSVIPHGFESGAVLEPEKAPSRSILVIDDEQAVLDVVRRFLEIAGHQVICTTSGKDGVAHIQTGNPVDLVIMDLMIPHEDGNRNFQALKSVRPKLPILLCTGLLQAESPFAQLRKQAVGVLRKPFRMNELWYVVNNAFSIPAEQSESQKA